VFYNQFLFEPRAKCEFASKCEVKVGCQAFVRYCEKRVGRIGEIGSLEAGKSDKSPSGWHEQAEKGMTPQGQPPFEIAGAGPEAENHRWSARTSLVSRTKARQHVIPTNEDEAGTPV
jgi:hypothetical protein